MLLDFIPYFRNLRLLKQGETTLGSSYVAADGTSFLGDGRVHIPEVLTLPHHMPLRLSKLVGVEMALERPDPGEPFYIYYGRGLTDVFRFDVARGEWFHRFRPGEPEHFERPLPELFGYGSFGPVTLCQNGDCEIAGLRFDPGSDVDGMELGDLTAAFKEGRLRLDGPALTAEFEFDRELNIWFATQDPRRGR